MFHSMIKVYQWLYESIDELLSNTFPTASKIDVKENERYFPHKVWLYQVDIGARGASIPWSIFEIQRLR